jgi:dTDP-4-amino-4,6-dideoxygalactose transaminase
LEHVPFNRPYYVGSEQEYVLAALAAGHLSGSGGFTARCEAELERRLGVPRVLLTPSGTAALELAAMLLDVGPGDEVIMPSFTFPSTANAFALRGATPVFVDIREDTLNLDERLVEAAITPRTRAIVPVHYAGVACEMDLLAELAERHGITLVEDAAQALLSSHRGRPLGGLGGLAALSFHETKNVTCGEGGALVLSDPALVRRAEIIRDKGTDRAAFFRGEVDRYTWVGLGSSFALSDVSAAFLWAQLEQVEAITRARLALWRRYDEGLAAVAAQGLLRRPVVPAHATHNAHMYYVLLADHVPRAAFLDGLRARGVDAVFHYVPLHSSPAGRELGRASGTLSVTSHQSERLVRLPLWTGMEHELVDRVVATVTEVATALAGRDVAVA